MILLEIAMNIFINSLVLNPKNFLQTIRNVAISERLDFSKGRETLQMKRFNTSSIILSISLLVYILYPHFNHIR
jgi:hypothetical protein